MSKEIITEWFELYSDDLARFLWRYGIWFVVCGMIGTIRICYEFLNRKDPKSRAELVALFILIFFLSLIMVFFFVVQGWYISGIICLFTVGIFGEKFLDHLKNNTANIFAGFLDKLSDFIKKK